MAYTNEAVGQVTEVTGEAKVIRADGTEEAITLGTEIFLGDVVETVGDGAVNIGFTDDSSFAISDNASVTIDEYVYDPVTESGDQDFSVARGVFMYTSGLIGRENPDAVEIETPVGSIGIRGTIIGGKIVPEGEGDSQITVIEGAIVVRNEAGEQILSNQFDTVQLSSALIAPSAVETLDVARVANDFGAVKNVSASLFTSFEDQAQAEEGVSEGLDESSVEETQSESDSEAEADANATEGESTENLEAQIDEAIEEIVENTQAKPTIDTIVETVAETPVNQAPAAPEAPQPVITAPEPLVVEPPVTNTPTVKPPVDVPITTPPTQSPPPPPAGTLDLLTRAIDEYSRVDGVEAFIPVGRTGAKLIDLTVEGSLKDSITASDFSIFGDYADYLRVVGNNTDGFSLALKSNFKVINVGGSDYQFSDDANEFGPPFQLDAPFNLGNVTVSKDGVASGANLTAVADDVALMSGSVADGNIFIGDSGDNTMTLTDNFGFKVIDGGEGQDKLTLDRTGGDGKGGVEFNFSNIGSPSNVGASQSSQNLKSIETIFFANNTDTLTIDINNILSLLKTSDSVLTIETDTQNLTGTLSGLNDFNLVDSSGNKTDLERNGFTHLTPGTQTLSADGTRYEVFQNEFGVIRIESQIDGANTGGF